MKFIDKYCPAESEHPEGHATHWHVYDAQGNLTSIRYTEPPHREYVVNNNLTVRIVQSRPMAVDELPQLPIQPST